jgi:hypothetical protein
MAHAAHKTHKTHKTQKAHVAAGRFARRARSAYRDHQWRARVMPGSSRDEKAKGPQRLARRAAEALAARPSDGFRRDSFSLPREAARAKARDLFRRFPKEAYMTEIEAWRVVPGETGEEDLIEFTIRRLPTAD